MPWWIQARRSPSVLPGHRGRITPASSTYGPREEGSTTAYPGHVSSPGRRRRPARGREHFFGLILVNRNHGHPGHFSLREAAVSVWARRAGMRPIRAVPRESRSVAVSRFLNFVGEGEVLLLAEPGAVRSTSRAINPSFRA